MPGLEAVWARAGETALPLCYGSPARLGGDAGGIFDTCGLVAFQQDEHDIGAQASGFDECTVKMEKGFAGLHLTAFLLEQPEAFAV